MKSVMMRPPIRIGFKVRFRFRVMVRVIWIDLWSRIHSDRAYGSRVGASDLYIRDALLKIE